MQNLLVTLGTVDAETWKTVGWVALIIAVIAVVIVLLILLVGKGCRVDTDEKVTKILENLAGANCGGCGCSGCSGFAQKLASGEGDLSACHVTSPEGKAEIAKLLGIELKAEERTVAVVHCAGTSAVRTFRPVGASTCAETAALFGGDKLCKEGCLGCGDCTAVCTESGVHVEDDVAQIDADKCIGCGACILTCPKHVIGRIPASAPVYVACSSHCRGKEVMAACDAGCIGCGLCAKKCPSSAITMKDNLPFIDYSKCTGCRTGPAAEKIRGGALPHLFYCNVPSGSRSPPTGITTTPCGMQETGADAVFSIGGMWTQSRLHEQSASVISARRAFVSTETMLNPSSVVTVTKRRSPLSSTRTRDTSSIV